MQLQATRMLRGPSGPTRRTAQLGSCGAVSKKPLLVPSRAGRHRLHAASRMDVWSMDDDIYIVAGNLVSIGCFELDELQKVSPTGFCFAFFKLQSRSKLHGL